MARHTDLDRIGVPPGEDLVEEPLEAGIGLRLGPVGRLGPTGQLGIHPLHGQVGPLDDADLRPTATGAPALVCPLAQHPCLLVGVGEVGLEHDAGIESGVLWCAQCSGEGGNREREIAVLLHVKVDEDGVTGGHSVEHTEAFGDAVDLGIEGDHVDTRHDRRHLDAHVVDVAATHGSKDPLEALIGLGVAQHRLTERVDVRAHPRLPAARQVLRQGPGTGVDDHARCLALYAQLNEPAHEPRRYPTDRRSGPEGQAVERADRRRRTELGETLERASRGRRPQHLVGEAKQETAAPTIAEKRPEAVGAAALGAGRIGVGGSDERLRSAPGARDELVVVDGHATITSRPSWPDHRARGVDSTNLVP